MFDLHCHILPGVDDGARSVTESRDMLRAAKKQGIGLSSADFSEAAPLWSLTRLHLQNSFHEAAEYLLRSRALRTECGVKIFILLLIIV